MAYWTLEDIPWHRFDAGQVHPDLVSLVKAASIVEHNGYDYSRYLCEVFTDDADFQQAAQEWAVEEVQHGAVLRRWAELADPEFNFDRSFHQFKTGYSLPVDVQASVRGSRTGELIARCVVETATSAYYTAIKEKSTEPVLQIICARIAADEYRHYKLFYTYLQSYLKKENVSLLKRFSIAIKRIIESEDDELAYAFFAAHHDTSTTIYNREVSKNHYMSYAYALYHKEHVQKMTSMTLKAIGMTPNGLLSRMLDTIAWNVLRLRAHLLINSKSQYVSSGYKAA